MTFVVVSLEEMAVIHSKESYWVNRRDKKLNEDGLQASNTYKEVVGVLVSLLMLIMWVNPSKFIYKRVRYSTIRAFYNVVIAPFGNVKFKAYILAEILTDCIIPLEDVGKVFTHIVLRDWDKNLINKSVDNLNNNI